MAATSNGSSFNRASGEEAYPGPRREEPETTAAAEKPFYGYRAKKATGLVPPRVVILLLQQWTS